MNKRLLQTLSIARNKLLAIEKSFPDFIGYHEIRKESLQIGKKCHVFPYFKLYRPENLYMWEYTFDKKNEHCKKLESLYTDEKGLPLLTILPVKNGYRLVGENTDISKKHFEDISSNAYEQLSEIILEKIDKHETYHFPYEDKNGLLAKEYWEKAYKTGKIENYFSDIIHHDTASILFDMVPEKIQKMVFIIKSNGCGTYAATTREELETYQNEKDNENIYLIENGKIKKITYAKALETLPHTLKRKNLKACPIFSQDGLTVFTENIENAVSRRLAAPSLREDFFHEIKPHPMINKNTCVFSVEIDENMKNISCFVSTVMVEKQFKPRTKQENIENNQENIENNHIETPAPGM